MDLKEEIARENNLYVKLPLLIKEIILSSALPLPTNKKIVELEIAEIKKIINAECDSTLNYLKKYNQAFME